ncbi:hypothetical protein BDD12DRAFT_744383, partial [Trichophaea hybrida]
ILNTILHHVLYMDIPVTTVPLLCNHHQQGISGCGSIYINSTEFSSKECCKLHSINTNTAIVRQVFGDSKHKPLCISNLVDNYNHHKNGVNLADQRQAAFTTQ